MVDMLFHIISVFGGACVVYAYYLLTAGKLKSTSIKYHIINAIGGVLLLISLLVHFNLGNFLIEIFWIYISITGIKGAGKDNGRLDNI